MTNKQHAALDFIALVEWGTRNPLIVSDQKGSFWAIASHQDMGRFDQVVYSYGAFVNSDANLFADDITARF